MAQQKGMKRAQKVLARKQKKRKAEKEANLRRLERLAEHGEHDHSHDHDHDHEHDKK